MNLVVLVGNLTRDPEVRYTQSGSAVANVNIAVNRSFTKEGGPDADFFRVTVFGKQAELVERYLSKGRKVGIEGRIQNDNYEKEGQTIYRDTIIANRIEFLSPKGGSDQFGSSGGQDTEAFGKPAPAQAFAAPATPAAPDSATPAAPEASTQTPAATPAPAQQAAVPTGFSALEDDEDDLPF
ncbi:MAG: single-stranded DNA-binding protein [Clostridiales Family XIII bacterium]|jgi:single-strand DNA-binding protein|nr:single-stranded DNA-binding protein [Clostridiales Family XIII bacterium]